MPAYGTGITMPIQPTNEKLQGMGMKEQGGGLERGKKIGGH